MSVDLVKASDVVGRLCDRIEQLERELERTGDVLESQAHVITDLRSQLSAERALADRLGRFVLKLHGETTAATAYRKARETAKPSEGL